MIDHEINEKFNALNDSVNKLGAQYEALMAISPRILATLLDEYALRNAAELRVAELEAYLSGDIQVIIDGEQRRVMRGEWRPVPQSLKETEAQP